MENNSIVENPKVVAFFDDLMLIARIESAARKAGFDVLSWGDPDLFGEDDRSADKVRPGEPIDGRAGVLMDQITSIQPALLIFDISFAPIPWRKWIPVLKSSPATRRLPILCFGPHVDERSLQEAVNLGANEVLPRSKFLSRTAEHILHQAKLHTGEPIAQACLDELSDLARAGLQAFNRGDYYQSHELLEDAWNKDETQGRELYRAILQIAVAYLQIERGNYRGAVKMFLRARQWVTPLPDFCRGINVALLKTDAERVYHSLLEIGPEGIAEFDSSLFKAIDYK